MRMLVVAFCVAGSGCGKGSAVSGGGAGVGMGSGSGTGAGTGAGVGSGSGMATEKNVGGERPYGMHLPSPSPAGPVPLVLFFHGYGATGAGQAREFGLLALADAHGFALAFPDGTTDGQGRRFWNATDACCNFGDIPVDDIAYARWILGDAAKHVPVDPARVYVVGFSNGGFLAHRIACELAPSVAAVVSVAGAQWSDPSRCTPSDPVSVLEIHGDADRVVRPDGGLVFNLPGRRYPNLAQTLATWAAKDACSGALMPTGRNLNFDGALAGAETEEQAYGGCPAGVSVTWWSVRGGGHIPNPTSAGMQGVWDWLRAHPKERDASPR
jgi:polyhydroxybutyrate depolymerase